MSNMKENGITEKHRLIFMLGVISIIAFIIYNEYIIENIPYLSSSDAWAQFFPYLSNISDYIRSEGIPMWSFSIGLGSPHSLAWFGDPFYFLAILAGKEIMPQLFIWMQIVKILITAAFFYKYLKKLNLDYRVCTFGAISLSFCGIMIGRGMFFSYSLEIAIVAILLWAIEMYVQENKWYYVPIALAFLFSSLGAYYIYLYAILLIIYATVRYIISQKFNWSKYGSYILKCGGLFLIGFLLSMLIVAPYIYSMLNSNRFDTVAGGINMRDFFIHFFSTGPNSRYLTMLYGMFSTDILGVYAGYKGFSDFLGMPILYIGILNILLIPQVFSKTTVKIKGVLIFLFGIIGLYLIFPSVTTIMNAFIAGHYKLSSLWVCIIFIIISCYSLDKIIKFKKINLKILIISFILIVGLLWFSFSSLERNGMELEKGIATFAFSLFIVYFVILFMIRKNTDFCLRILLLITCGELCIMGCINSRSTVYYGKTYADFNNGTYFYSNLNEAADYLKQYDSGFYRSVLSDTPECEALYLNTYSTAVYDSFVVPSYIEFFNTVSEMGFGRNHGFQELNAINTLVGVKYVKKANIEDAPFGYKMLMELSEGYLFENEYALPLGFSYNQYLTRNEYDALSVENKQIALLEAVILDDEESNLIKYQHMNVEPEIKEVEIKNRAYYNVENVIDNIPESIEYDSINIDPMVILDFKHPVSGDIEVSFEITSEINDFCQIFWSHGVDTFSEERAGILNFEKGTNSYSIQLDSVTANSIRLDVGNNPGHYKISNIKIIQKNKNLFNDAYCKAVQKRKTEEFVIEEFSQNYIKGKVSSEGNNKLFFSIPYDKGWTIKVDGEKSKVEKINVGFLGVDITDGEHVIELSYTTPGLIWGFISFSIALIGYIFFLIVRKKIPLFSMKELLKIDIK